jgi:hypothetical protein
LLQHIGRVVDHVDIDPEHPVFVVEGAEQQVVAGARQHRAPHLLERPRPTGHARGDVEAEIAAEEFRPARTLAEARQERRGCGMGAVGAVALEQGDGQLLARPVEPFDELHVAREVALCSLDRREDKDPGDGRCSRRHGCFVRCDQI